MKSSIITSLMLLAAGMVQAQFGPQQLIATLDEAFALHTADIDSDGDLDVFAAGMFSDRVAWYENLDGNGTFGAENLISDDAYLPQSVYGADLDGDGDIDLAVGKYAGSIATWYENLDGLGTFGPEQVISNTGQGVWQLLPADADNDGDLDLFMNLWTEDRIVWFENTDAHGNYGPERLITENTSRPTGIAIADLDSDGDMDVVSTSHNDNKLAWYKNTDGQGTYGSEQIISNSVTQASRVQAGDLDGDGDIDLVATSYNNNIFYWFENTDGQGSYASPRTIDTNQTDNIYLTDLDQDGDIDILSTHNNSIGWYENTNGLGTFGPQQLITTDVLASNQALAADLDGDAMPDVLSVSRHDDKVAWYENLRALGMEEITPDDISIFPNPSSGNLTVDMGAEYTNVSITIYNALGKLVVSEEYASARTIKQHVDFPAGIYLLKIRTSENLLVTKKIIKI